MDDQTDICKFRVAFGTRKMKILSSLGPWSHIPNGQTSKGETQISERNSNVIENLKKGPELML